MGEWRLVSKPLAACKCLVSITSFRRDSRCLLLHFHQESYFSLKLTSTNKSTAYELLLLEQGCISLNLFNLKNVITLEYFWYRFVQTSFISVKDNVHLLNSQDLLPKRRIGFLREVYFLRSWSSSEAQYSPTEPTVCKLSV